MGCVEIDHLEVSFSVMFNYVNWLLGHLFRYMLNNLRDRVFRNDEWRLLYFFLNGANFNCNECSFGCISLELRANNRLLGALLSNHNIDLLWNRILFDSALPSCREGLFERGDPRLALG